MECQGLVANLPSIEFGFSAPRVVYIAAESRNDLLIRHQFAAIGDTPFYLHIKIDNLLRISLLDSHEGHLDSG